MHCQVVSVYVWHYLINSLHLYRYTVKLNISYITDDTIDDIMEFARRSGSPHPLIYDEIVRCLGWRHDLTAYAESGTTPTMQPNGK